MLAIILSAPVSPAVCCRLCSCAVQQSEPKWVCLLGLQGAVLQPWKLVSCASLASAVPVSQGMPLKCFQLLAAPLKCPAGNLQPVPGQYGREQRCCLGSSGSVPAWHCPSGRARLRLGSVPAGRTGSGDGAGQRLPAVCRDVSASREWIVALGCARRCSEGGGALPQGRATQGTFVPAAIPARGRGGAAARAPGTPLGTALRLAPAQVCWGGEEGSIWPLLCLVHPWERKA